MLFEFACLRQTGLAPATASSRLSSAKAVASARCRVSATCGSSVLLVASFGRASTSATCAVPRFVPAEAAAASKSAVSLNFSQAGAASAGKTAASGCSASSPPAAAACSAVLSDAGRCNASNLAVEYFAVYCYFVHYFEYCLLCCFVVEYFVAGCLAVGRCWRYLAVVCFAVNFVVAAVVAAVCFVCFVCFACLLCFARCPALFRCYNDSLEMMNSCLFVEISLFDRVGLV